MKLVTIIGARPQFIKAADSLSDKISIIVFIKSPPKYSNTIKHCGLIVFEYKNSIHFL